MNGLKILFTILLLASASTYLFSQEKVDLQYHMPKGKTYLYRTVVSTVVTQENMGRKMKVMNDVHSITRVVVDSVADNGNLSLVVSPDSIRVHSSMYGRDTTLTLKTLEGIRTRLDISKYGKIIKRALIDSLSDRAQMMGSSIIQSISNLYAKLPGKKISDGANWTNTRTDSVKSMGGEMIVKSDYTYSLKGKEMKNGINCYKIPYSAKITSHGEAAISGMDFSIEGTGKMSGTIYSSVSDGSVVGIDGQNENNMNLSTSGDQKMVVPVTQSSTLKTELIKD